MNLKRAALRALNELSAEIQAGRAEVTGVAIEDERLMVSVGRLEFEEEPENVIPKCPGCGGPLIHMNGGATLCERGCSS